VAQVGTVVDNNELALVCLLLRLWSDPGTALP
jgi:hypothetical protein